MNLYPTTEDVERHMLPDGRRSRSEAERLAVRELAEQALDNLACSTGNSPTEEALIDILRALIREGLI